MIYPIPPRNYPGKDCFAFWEGFLTDADIDLLLSQPEWAQKEEGIVGLDGNTFGQDKKIRSTEVAWLARKPELEEVWAKLSGTIAEVNRRFFHFDLTGIYEPMQLGNYAAEKEAHYTWHIDANVASVDAPRKLSMALMLNDPSEFEGGELQIKVHSDDVQTLELKKGRAWFFPSYVLHRVAPVTKGVRKSAVLWVGGPAFK